MKHECPRCRNKFPCVRAVPKIAIEPYVVVETRNGAPYRAMSAPDEESAMDIAKMIVQSIGFSVSFDSGTSDSVSVFDLTEQPAANLIDLNMLEDWITEYDLMTEAEAEGVNEELQRAGLADTEEDHTHDYHPGAAASSSHPTRNGLRVIPESEVFGTSEEETPVGEDIVRKTEKEDAEEDRTVRIVRVEGEELEVEDKDNDD